LGQELEVRVERIAHGGHAVARHDGRVIFVRHALPGELVRAEITEEQKSFLRADAVEIVEVSPDRVEPPCPLAHAGGCGGCDFQHVALPAQRKLKGEVVAEQLRRLAGIEWDVDVEEVAPTLHWRTRMQYVELPGGRRGLRKHRSHDVIEVDECLIEAADARMPTRDVITEQVRGRAFAVAGDGFWQVHPSAPEVLVNTVRELVDAQPGERVLDLYAGVGLFTAFLAETVGPEGSVVSVEGNRRASRLARRNLADLSQVRVVCSPVETAVQGPADIVVLDPPRAGAKRAVMEAIAAVGPRAIAYVACDPAALARDVAYAAEAGYALVDLKAYDLFPMTHHVECVALLSPR
jgi:tRNA/tmRNA/rRNA uracil-C5-methylase (TrmA/RlmC/RlmD family)